MTRDQRRLTAIVSADVVGYSRLMGLDESGTLVALKSHLRELIDPKIAEYGGRTVKSMGDGLLLEFPSVVDAVRCAVDVQLGMADRNAVVAAEKQIQFRVGINVGDIIIDGDDIHGDGVNVAARLQTLADPGGICASKVVRDQVLDKLSFTFEDLGSQRVKNIARPVEVFRVALDGEPVATRGQRALRRWPLSVWAVLGAGFAGFVAIVSTLFWWDSPRDTVALPYAMSVAMLPFTAPSGNPADDRAADMLGSSVTTILSADRWMRVVPQRRVAGGIREVEDPRRLGRELHVRYQAIGELHREGDKVAVLIHLIDTETGSDAWSDRFEFEATQLESDQVRSALRIERRVWNGIYKAAQRHAKENPTSGDPWNSFLRALDFMETGGNLSVARAQLEQVLRIDPDFVPALSAVSDAIEDQLVEDTNADGARIEKDKKDLDRLSSRAVVLGAADSNAWRARAYALTWLGRWDEALAAIARARTLDPGGIVVIRAHADILLVMGRPDEALAVTQQALAMDPETIDMVWFSDTLCESNLMLGRYAAATPACEQGGANGKSWRAQARLIAVYAQQSQMAKAATAKAATLKLEPALTVARLQAMPNPGNQAYLEALETHFYAGLRKANFPER